MRRKGGKRNPWVLQIHFIHDKAINKYTVNVASWVTDYCCFLWAFTEQELCRHKWNCKCTLWVGAHSANQTRTPQLQVPARLSYPQQGQTPAACHRRTWREEEKGHVYSAVHQSTSIPLLLPRLWTSSSLRQKRDILWILVLLAHCTHIVSVAEDEVLFFLKRGLRVLGGACRETRQLQRHSRKHLFLPYNTPIFVGPLWIGSRSTHEIMQKFWPWRSVMNGQVRTNLFKKPVVHPGVINTFLSGSWLEVRLRISNNSTVERARSNGCHLQQLMDLEIKLVAGSQLWYLPAHPALSNPSTAPQRVQLMALKSWRWNTPGL